MAGERHGHGMLCVNRPLVGDHAPWYVPNPIIHTDLQIPTVKAEITNFSTKYREKLITNPNELTPALLGRRAKKIKTFQTN